MIYMVKTIYDEIVERFLYMGYEVEYVKMFMPHYQYDKTFEENVEEFKKWLEAVKGV